MRTGSDTGDARSRALVLGCGGIAAIAWQTGLLAGLARHDVDVLAADLVVGTSAGSTVAAQISGPKSLEDLVGAQLDGTAGDEPPPAIDLRTWFATWQQIEREAPDGLTARRRLGEFALASETVPERSRFEVIEQRVPERGWPDRALAITAIDAATGELVVFDRDAGISLTEAVCASCAIPGVWPPTTYGGRRYIDGGVRSTTNEDVAADHEHVLVVQPLALPEHHHVPKLDASTDIVRVRPAPEARDTILRSPLDPGVRAACAEAGLDQAADVADTLRGRWPSISVAGEGST